MTQPLPYADGDVTFRLPLVVAPRYIPGSALPGSPAGTGVAADTDAVPDASRISPPVLLPGFPNPVRLSVTADIDPAGLALSGIRSSLHAVTQHSADDGHVIVELAPGERLDRDFVLRLAVADPASVTGSLVLCPDESRTAEPGPAASPGPASLGAGTFMLTLVPPSAAPAGAPRDVVIVLDRSGSMGGWKMVAARRAAARIVDTLSARDRFAVLCFDNDTVQPPEQANRLVTGTDRNRFRAVEFLAGMSARGGTEMLPALELAAGLLSAGAGDSAADSAGDSAADGTGEDRTARQRVLVLVTDGQVGNEDQILHQLSMRLAGARVHTVGIDRAVNAGFLTRLADIGRGRCELVESRDRLDEAMAQIHERIASPVITGLTLQSAGLRLVAGCTAPARMPDLFAGAPVLICGRYDGGGAEASITVRGVSADGSGYEQVLTGTPGRFGAATATWARGYLRELEDLYTCLATDSPAELERLEDQIVAVSLRFGVLCRFTAFLAVDSRVVTEGGTPHRVTQPVELPAGWELSRVPGGDPADLAMSRTVHAIAGMPAKMAQPGWADYLLADAAPAAPGQAARLARRPPRVRRGRPGVHRGPLVTPASAPDPMPLQAANEAVRMIGVPQWAIDQIRAELDWLDAGARDLPADLADLGSRLAVLLTSLSSHGIDPVRLAGLRELVTKLQPGGDGRIGVADAVVLRERAREILRELLGDDPRSRSPFWKRTHSSQ
jgi:Ca-activated chloride channel family protein